MQCKSKICQINTPNYFSTTQDGWQIPGRGYLNNKVNAEYADNTVCTEGVVGRGYSIERKPDGCNKWPVTGGSGFDFVE